VDTKDAGARGGRSRSRRKLKAAQQNLARARGLTTEERRANGKLGALKRAQLEALAAKLVPHLGEGDWRDLTAGNLAPLDRLSPTSTLCAVKR
jgi:hypothetical protein